MKELLVPKVRSAVDGLPYNTEGYERAKAILTAKYGKPSEVANAHIAYRSGITASKSTRFLWKTGH